MTINPSYEDLEQRIKSLEKETAELKEANEALRESEERFRNLAEGSIQGILIHRDHKPLFVNQAFAVIFGYTPEEMLGMDSIVPLYSPQDKTRLIEYKNNRLRGEEVPVDYEYQGVRKDGALIWLENIVRVIQWEGQPAIQATIFNISKRKQAEEELRESEERYRLLIEAAGHSGQAIILQQDKDCLEAACIFFNETAAEITGYSREELSNLSWDNIIFPEYRDTAMQRYRRRMDGEVIQDIFEVSIIRKDGIEIPIEICSILSEYQGARALITFFRDITDRRQAEMTIRQHNAYLSALHETALGLMRRLDLDELLEAIVSRVALLVGTEDGYVYLCDDEKDYIEMRVGLGEQKAYEGLRLKPGEGVAGKVWETGKPLNVNDYQVWHGRLHGARYDDIRASIGIPLKSESDVLGVIGLAYFEENKKFGEQEASILSRFAELASIALDNARLYSNLKQELAERKKAESALRESELKYKILTENSLAGIYIHQDDKYVFINERFAKMLGYAPDELLGRKHYEFAHPDQREMTKKRAYRRLAGEKVPKRYELRRLRKNGKAVWHEIMASDPIDYQDRPAIMGHAIDISARKKAEEMLKKANEELEQRVENRTIELRISNEQLEIQKKNLEEVNTALRVLLKKRDEDKSNMEQKVMFNMNELILPYVVKLNSSNLDERQKVLLDILESNLYDITSPFSQSLSHNYIGFTPSEMQIANLIKQGKTSKQIAELLNLSSRTIETHRKNIRKKLGLGNKKINLRTHLLSIQ